jgi:hypothetical protein
LTAFSFWLRRDEETADCRRCWPLMKADEPRSAALQADKRASHPFALR